MEFNFNVERGINVIGYFQRSLGQGETARLMIQSLEQKKIPYSIYSVDHLAVNHHLENIKEPISQKLIYSTNLFCIDADHITHVVEQLNWDEFKNRYNIGLWFWETNLIPKQKRKCWDYLDEIWVTSAYTQEHLSTFCPKPVFKIPHPINLNFDAAKNSKNNFNLSNKFTFLFCFDFYSCINRKNPLAIIKAFQKAFPENAEVQLVIKSQNGKKFSQKMKTVLELIMDDSRIIWMDKELGSQQRFDLMNACDCYVSLHRSEGFGLTMAEAMALGKPVIATGYSGNLDFMNQENSFLCAYQLIRVGEGNSPYPSKGIWADVDIEHVVYWMKYMISHPEDVKERAHQGKVFINKYHSCKSVGQEIAIHYNRIPVRTEAKKRPLRYKISRIVKVYKRVRKLFRPLKRWAEEIFTHSDTDN